MKPLRIIAQSLAVLLALAIVPVSAAPEPYDFYALVAETGAAAFLGRGEASTLGIFEKYVNATGGIAGHPLHIIIEDDASNPANSVQLANQIIAKHVPAFVGPSFGATCSAVMPLVLNTGPVMYCMSNVIHPAGGTYAFSYSPSTVNLAASAFRYLKARGVRKIGILTTTDASGQDGEQVSIENLRSPEFKDIQVVANEHMAVTDLSANAQLARIKAAGAQAIDAWVTGTPYGTVLRGLVEVGYEGTVMTNGGNINKTQMEQYAQFIPRDQILIGQPNMRVGIMPAAVRVAKATFLDQMHQAGIANPDQSQFIAWDPMLIIVDALRHLGTQATATQVRNYILKLHDFAGINGTYDFRRGDQRGIDPRSSVIVRWDKAADDFVTVSEPGGIPFK